jgi:hypothetical protein
VATIDAPTALSVDPIGDTAQAAKLCREVIGAQVTAFAVGVKDPRGVKRWEDGASLKRSDDERRLLALATVIQVLQSRHGNDFNRTRAWLLAPNPRLGDMAAVEWIREQESATTVVRAARTYVR